MEKFISKLALFLLILGGLNFGIISLFGINVIAMLFDNDEQALAVRIIYAILSACAIWCISLLFSDDDSERIRRRY